MFKMMVRKKSKFTLIFLVYLEPYTCTLIDKWTVTDLLTVRSNKHVKIQCFLAVSDTVDLNIVINIRNWWVRKYSQFYANFFVYLHAQIKKVLLEGVQLTNFSLSL